MFTGKFVKEPGFLFLCVLSVAVGRQLTNEELHRLPKLFHLDNYERCLSQEYGLYCLGTFELSAEPSHPVLELMKEHSKGRNNFNRTLLHRGYCVSQRCPVRKSCMDRNKYNFERTTSNSSQYDFEQRSNFARKKCDFEQDSYDFERNSYRFERCVAKFARHHSFTARLTSLQYCITHKQYQSKLNPPLNNDQWMFIYAIVFILLLNIIGTFYDWTGSKGSSLVLAWSLRANWARFTRVDESALMRSLAPLQLSRLAMQWVIIYAHTLLTHTMVYVNNPEELEKSIQGSLGNLLRNGTSVVQVFILISCFLTGLNFLLLVNKNAEINVMVIIKWIFKRLFRIYPVYLFVLGFATTWWAHIAEGPLWSTVRTESTLCKRKFWTQVFFVNNMVEPSDFCLLQSWALAIDIQMYIISLVTIYILLKKKANGPKILAVLFVLSALLNVLLAYFTGWEPMVRLIYPENLRVLFKNTPTMPLVHMSIWGNLPACFLGLFTAYFYFEMTKKAKAQHGNEIKSIDDEKVENKVERNEVVRNEINRNGWMENADERNVVAKNDVKKDGVAQNKFKRNEVLQDEVKSNGVFQNEIKRNGFIQNGDEKNCSVQNEKRSNGTVENEIESNGFVHSKVALFERWYSKGSNRNEHNGRGDQIKRHGQNNIDNYGLNHNEIESNERDGFTTNDFISKNNPNENGKGRLGLKKMVFYLLRKADIFALPCLLTWIYLGTHIETYESKAAIALYVGMERIVFSGLFAMFLLSIFNYDGFLRRVAAWDGWQALGRLVYTLTMLHWCVMLSLAASRQQPVITSLFRGAVDWLATICFTYLLALPLCLMVELPAQKFFDILINKLL